MRDTPIIAYTDFTPAYIDGIPIAHKPRGQAGSFAKSTYYDIVCAFDIETTRLADIEQAFCYIWQFQFGERVTVIGRTIQEFVEFLINLKQMMKQGISIVIYVHNLSYEFQFLSGVIEFDTESVFALDIRKVLKCTAMGCFEFRCSYIHSNMPLAMYTDKFKAEHKKLSGDDFDYSKIRYPWTPLTPIELRYCVNDVVGLVESLQNEMSHDGDTLYTIPLTSTGYVRRDAKKAMRLVNHKFVKSLYPDIEIYTALREAFRGGNTHANRYYAGVVLTGVKSADRSSSYPDEQCNRRFPVTPFEKETPDFQTAMHLMCDRHKALLLRVRIWGLSLISDWWGFPYIPRDKCRNLVSNDFDNGRVLSADYLEITITDIDLQIILDEYNFTDLQIINLWSSRYGYLPRPLIDCTIGYYRAKTELKGVAGQDLHYIKSKNKLNSIYGMMAQNPVKRDIKYTGTEFIVDEITETADILEKNKRRAFLTYQWGVWVTAWARYDLEQGLKLAGEGGVYCDTDSVKYIGSIDWTAYNNHCIENARSSGSYATDPQGITHYMGVYEFEGEYNEFVTLGAKKYVYCDTDGKLHCTIAGVNKNKGGAELERAGGISAFKDGFTFTAAGGTESVYNDDDFGTIYVDGHSLTITKNVVIRDSTYTLGLTGEYDRLLRTCFGKYVVDRRN